MYCSTCGANNDATAKFCHACGQPVAVSSAAVPPVLGPGTMRGGPQTQVVQPRLVTGKSPVVAALLSALVVGVGQFYNGDVKKGVILLAAAVILGGASLGVLWFVCAAVSAVDAYRVANGTGKMW